MRQELRAATVLFVLLSLLTGVIYPLLVTAVGQTAFRAKAGGSLIIRDSRLIHRATSGAGRQPQARNRTMECPQGVPIWGPPIRRSLRQ
jgi:hypothetical protein